MYYYVFEQPKNKREAGLQNRIIAELEAENILGEAVIANPIQKPKELVEIGLEKGFRTIVLAGSDSFVNNLAPIIAEKKRVVGIIPLARESSFWNLIGCYHWREIIKALPQRRTENFDLVRLGQEKFFLTFVKIEDQKQFVAFLEFPDFKIVVPAKTIIFTNGGFGQEGFVGNYFLLKDGKLQVLISGPKDEKRGGIFSFFKKSEKVFSTKIPTPWLKIKTERPEKILAPDGTAIGQTPAGLAVEKNAVRIIVKRRV